MQSLFVAAFLEDYPSHQQRYSYPAPRLFETSCDDSDLDNTDQGNMDDPRNSIFDVQSLLDHEQVTTTQLYASHRMNAKRDLVNDMEWELERKDED